MPQRHIGINVFDASIERMERLYSTGHRIVVSFSAGKDSGICLEICRIAARKTNRLPVEVAMRDEEIMFPGTFEYARRIADDSEISFKWSVMGQPIMNVYNRRSPYWWVFDNRLKPEQWVRIPPEDTVWETETNHIHSLINADKYPPEEGKELFAVIGLRTQESPGRKMGLYSSKGYLTGLTPMGNYRKCRPIYDWGDGDVWKAINDNKWDYNSAYDVMNRLGVSRSRLRIAPPTLSSAGFGQMKIASKAWPRWFTRVCKRLPSVRLAALYGKQVIRPRRNKGETWEDCYQRTCIDEAPDWIAERATTVKNSLLTRHKAHSTSPFPQVAVCHRCNQVIGSWMRITRVMFNGDPFTLKQHYAEAVEPDFFREDAGKWEGRHTW